MSWFRETMLKAEAKADQFENWVKDSVGSAADQTKQAASDTVDRTNEFVDDYQSSTEDMLDRVPGYSGYKDKERRRDSDRALREQIARDLESSADRVEALERTAASARDVERVNQLEPLVQGLRNLANLVRTQSYGYAGLFSDRPVDDIALNQLRLFDEGLLVKTEAISTTVAGLESGDAGAADAIAKQIAEYKSTLKLRKNVIDEGRPAKAEKPPAAASKAAKAFEDEGTKAAEPVTLPDVSLGDAMSVLGDDHLVEAIIDVDTGDATQRFIRLDNTPQLWLWLSSDPGRTPKQLLGTEVSDLAASETLQGRATITVPDERTRSGPATIQTGRSADGAEIVRLDIDGAAKSFTATDTHMDDIETYRAR